MITLTKELLSSVLDAKVQKIVTDLRTIHFNIRSDVKESEIAVFYNNQWHIWNIYELAHKCKEWAFCKGYELRISSRNNISVIDFFDWKYELYGEFIDCLTYELVEPEAIFKACQWISEK